MTREERDALLSGDIGRCSDSIGIADSEGRSCAFRCSKSAWHRRNHRASIRPGVYVRWAGDGSLAAEGLPPLERAALDVLRARARARVRA